MATLASPMNRSGTRRALAASFASRTEARAAVRDLRAAGFTDAHVGVMSADKSAPREAKSGLPNDPTESRWEEGTGIGAAGTFVLGILLFREPRDWPRLLCVALILAGIVGLKLLTPPAAPPLPDGAPEPAP